MRTTTKKRRTRIASRVLLLAAFSAILFAQGKPKAGEPYAVVTGTVFLDSGQSVPGAKVVLALKQNPARKLQEQTSTARGEFSFRVPAGKQQYVLTATLKGFVSATKDVEIEAQEQIHATLLLERESK
jgi:hypothetical protein